MTTIGERIRYLRKIKLKIKSCDDFGAKIGLSGSNIRNIENSRVNATDRVISDICSTFSVNEYWIRNGGPDEDIFIKLSKDEEIAMYAQMLLDSTDDSVTELIKNFIVTYYKLDDTSKQLLKNIANDLLDKQKNG